ncbi:MAG: N-acetylmuramoyl-L-alanine amidase [Caulobacterales bacterium]
MRRVLVEGLKARWVRVAMGLGFAAACAVAVAAGVQRPAKSDVIAVRFGGDSSETRIVVDLDRAASGKIDDAAGAGRMELTLKGVSASGVLQGRGKGLVRAWTVEEADGGARLSLDLAQGANVARRFLIPPADGVANYRYVLDIALRPGAPRRPPITAASSPAPAPAEVAALIPVKAPEPPPLHLRKVIVIDAGHGGKDPGAGGANSNEKDVTLAAAEVLKARLEREGRYQVVMTRDSDVFIPLEMRVQIARKVGADLFISLHADSGPETATHGASVYTLSERGGSRVGYVLDRNEWFLQPTAGGGDRAVGQILLDLTQRSTRNRSAVFAQTLIDRVGDRAPLLPRSHRDAGYFVLLAPDVPAALLEMGFITNPSDEARLNDESARDALMDKVAEAIDAYFAGETKLASR